MGRITIPTDLLDTLKDPATLRFFLYCLTQAATEEGTITVRGKTITLSPGQLIFNRRKATVELEDYGLSERKIRTALSKCVASQKVSQKTSQKITVLTIVNFSTYGVSAGSTVPITVPITVPEKTNKIGQEQNKTVLRRTTRNTKNSSNSKNKEGHPKLRENISQVLHHYRSIFPTFGRTVRPGHKDWNLIGDRLADGYSIDECFEAVNGHSVDPWYKAKGMHSLRYIFKDADLMDRFIQTWRNHHQPVISDKAKRGAQAAHAWANRKEETP